MSLKSKRRMVRCNFFIEEKAIKFLEELPGPISAHIRGAVDDYIIKIENKNITTSPTGDKK